jgi:hypothetical protein
MALIPPVGTSGIYKLASPFSTQLQQNMSYRCDAVRRISDYIEADIDPYTELYVPNNISKAQYDQDLLNQVCIISLVSAAGHWVYVPSTYIIAYPDLNGVPYTVIVVGLEIGAVPNYRDLSGFKRALADLTRDTIGVTPTIREVVISAEQKLSQADHDALENSRNMLITNSQTDRARLLAAQTELAALRQQYAQLEAFVQSNMTAPG